jgi:hypothetical protein
MEPCSQGPATGPNPEQGKSSPHTHITFTSMFELKHLSDLAISIHSTSKSLILKADQCLSKSVLDKLSYTLIN